MNVLTERGDLAQIVKKYDMLEGELPVLIAATRERLYDVRGKRDKPITDDKLVSAWNGE